MTYLTSEEMAAIDLPKWPGCDVTGEPVTPEQAMEILVRTNGSFYSNDREFEDTVKQIFYSAIPHPDWGDNWWVNPPYDPKVPNDFPPTDELRRVLATNYEEYIDRSKTLWDRAEQYGKEMGVLGLGYLTNEQVCSCYIGGPNGWCDWSGNVYQRGNNIGKWPSTTEVFDEWKLIAEAFPFLNLTCRLLTDEAGHEEGDEPTIAIVYEVQNGEVKARLSNEEDMKYVTTSSHPSNVDKFITDFNNPYRERGVTPDKWKQACEYVANKRPVATF